MTEKVKITQEQADAIRLAVADYGSDMVLDMHKQNPYWITKLSALDKMAPSKLGRALYIGYEVELKFKVGDWVVHDSEQGAEVVREIRKRVVETNKRSHFYYHFRYATPEEIAEEKEKSLWKSIGREVGEFKSGDVIEYKSGYIRKVKRSGFHNLSVFVLASTAKKHYLNGEIARFYPEDSALDFDGGDAKCNNA